MTNKPIPDHYFGYCRICGYEGCFLFKGGSVRESYECPECRSSLRYQGQADILIDKMAKNGSHHIAELVKEKEFSEMTLYEPGRLGPFRRFFADHERYVTSFYSPDVKEGDCVDGVPCQNLMHLTFPDNTFDVIITSDIFEHIRKPYLGFSEIRRVLKPGGFHIFSIPIQHPMPKKTVLRVDTSGNEDVLLLPAVYHIYPHLVYTDFGKDMLAELDHIGLPTQAIQFDSSNPSLAKLLTFCSVKA